MRGGRENRERGSRETGQVAVPLATAQQTKELYHVREAQAIGIPDQDQGWGFEGGYACCPVVVGCHQLSDLSNEGGPGFWPGRGAEIGVMDRSSGERFSADCAHGRQVFGVPAIPFEGG